MESLVLIGSRALALRNPEILRRKPLDFDFVCTEESLNSWMEMYGKDLDIKEEIQISPNKKAIKASEAIIEFEIARPNSNAEELIRLVQKDPSTKESKIGLVPSLDMLFTIKTSHRYLKNSPHFWKNLFDYHAMKNAGAKIRPEWAAWLKWREKETYAYKHPRLARVSKNDFFDPTSGVNYLYDHDSIHESVAAKEKPAYRFYQKPESEVECSKEMFFNCTEEIRCLGVLEESYVLALERSQVPYNFKPNRKESFKMAFSKVCTSITSGWFREFAYENAMKILPMYEDSYVDKFFAGLHGGIVKSFSGDKNPYK